MLCGAAAAVTAAALLAGCGGGDEAAVRELSITTTSPTTTIAGTTDGLRAPGATLPQVDGESAVPFESAELVSITNPAVASVAARTCEGDVVPSTAFAIDANHFVANASSLADQNGDPDEGVDPRPWLHLGDGSWVRGTVVGVSKSPNLAVIEVEATLDRSLGWADDRPSKDDWGAVVGYPARSDGGSDLLAARVADPVGEPDVPMVTVTGAAAGRSGPGNMGAPFVDAEGQVQGMVVVTDGKGDTMVVQEATIVRDLAEGFIEAPEKPKTVCEANSKDRLKLGWGLLLERDGSETEATQLGGRDSLAEHGRVGVVDGSLPVFVADGASAAVVLGPFGSLEKAEAAQSPVAKATAKLDLDGDAEVVLVPWTTFPAEAPAPPTTIPVAPPTTPAPTTKAPATTTKPTTTTKSTGTTTDERASSADCSGSRSVRVIRGAPAGYSYKMRSGPSKSAAAVALGANGKQVSVVNGSATNGYVKIALPDGRCVWGASQYLG
ncbi:MAG: trypsin-like peptidase domain-containing protein [Microthrixaceae bacterium]|nr:trypsin-like peptidase domain-containing protein [Microthrixaceae bacterium]